MDLIVVEGFKHEAIPKIEVYRPMMAKPLLADDDPYVIAVAADGPVNTALPVLDLNDASGIAEFVMRWLESQRSSPKLVSSRRK